MLVLRDSRALPLAPDGRFRLDATLASDLRAQLARDARAGLRRRQKAIPPKYFYDDAGSRLFDAICDTPEYYLTHAEARLLEAHADAIVAAVRPTHLVELGPGAARKTRLILDAVERAGLRCVYVPLEVSETMLRETAAALLHAYPWLRVEAVAGDYERSVDRLPQGERRLVAFLGGTLGNFTERGAVRFLARVRARLRAGDALLVGADLVKDPAVLHAAYNDAPGLTAAFNKNVLHVLNRELGADFDPARFDHVAFYDPCRTQIEMHLRARIAHTVRVRALGMDVPFRARETLHTEISRKFTRASIGRTLSAAGFTLREYRAGGGDFSLSLSAPARATARPGR